MSNIDRKTVRGFGQEWAALNQADLPEQEGRTRFEEYFSMFEFNEADEGFDLGCGSGRWAKYVAPRVRLLHCIDPAEEAIGVAQMNLRGLRNVDFHAGTIETAALADESQDFGYSVGVLHHIPDTEAAMRQAVAKLKPRGQFLVYIYYNLEDRPRWFRNIWRVTDIGRRAISRLPFPLKRLVSLAIAATVYWPVARLSRPGWPLHYYRDKSFYTMKTDALDRFGTRLERRFSKDQVRAMMQRSGLAEIRFSPDPPFWVAIGKRSAQ